MDRYGSGVSLAQASLENGMAEVHVKSNKEEFEDEDEADDDSGYGHYTSEKDASAKNQKYDDELGEGKDVKAKAAHKSHHLSQKHQHLAPAEPVKTKAQKAAEKKAAADAKAKKAADSKDAKANPKPVPVKGMPPIKNIDKLNGRMIVIRGQHGPKYSFG